MEVEAIAISPCTSGLGQRFPASDFEFQITGSMLELKAKLLWGNCFGSNPKNSSMGSYQVM
jgi:hypothetical protein